MERIELARKPNGINIWREKDGSLSLEYRRVLTGEKVCIEGFTTMRQVREEIRLMEQCRRQD
jgi:hypothetical protein